MGANIITKTDRQMEDRLLAVAGDPLRADTLQKARAFKRTWLELAEALTKVQSSRSWEQWGFSDFDAYCRKELHLRGSTVAKLLGSFRFLETSAPRVIERARSEGFEGAPIPSLPAVEFVQKATERAAADPETIETIKRVAFDEGLDAPLLAKKFKEIAFPESSADKREKLRSNIAQTARKLSSLIAEEGSPVPTKLAIRVEEIVGELLEAIEN
ncbi:MAG TPA: hypothetical protein VFS15_19160 [Kofleriaceae bacterium]|nr:hypothetical protein [Kofleriaceae bacterium]